MFQDMLAMSNNGGGNSRVQCGTFTAAVGDNVVPIDFEPSKLIIYKNDIMTSSVTTGTPNGMRAVIYDKDLNSAKYFTSYCLTGGWYGNAPAYPTSAGLKDITSSSFTFAVSSSSSAFAGEYYFIAVE